MDMELFFGSFCKKLPWSVVSQVLKKHQISPSQGADKTISRLVELYKSKKITQSLINEVKGVYNRYTRFGDKTLSIDVVDKNDLSRLIAVATSAVPDIKASDINFPYYDDKTDKLLTEDPVFVHQEVLGKYIHLYFASVRTITETISIDDSFFAQNNSSFKFPVGIFDVSAKQRVKRRYYDVITVDTSAGHIFYKLDISVPYISPEITTIKTKLHSKFITMIGKSIARNKHNLFPAVGKIYKSSQGRVCELGYQVSAVTHGEKMRSKHKDLRREKFHQGGKSVVPSVDVFRIANRYETTDPIINVESEILLPGQTRMLTAGQSPFLNYAILTKCLNDSDFQKHIDNLI
ncbi:hypothetical protein MHM93_10950 [Pseudoalteromonas sp. MM17-2]|uniref:hypothetical protein n=1 Tax=Pseudoalteromonas sp. MM17-2 TaxID=2917753 RepID=UPI001EF446BC|nr:hypothetical protein [Pseudoalteromonas sp. MM17-2]MCG7544698.1 hypothetical protein [Pseudoalteromonas sp. MM17-2]